MRTIPKGLWACCPVVTPGMGWEWSLPIAPSQKPLNILLSYYYSHYSHFTKRETAPESLHGFPKVI